MKCPACGAAELVHDTRDMSYTYKGKTTLIPTVTGDYCPACAEVVLDMAEAERYGLLVRAQHFAAKTRYFICDQLRGRLRGFDSAEEAMKNYESIVVHEVEDDIASGLYKLSKDAALANARDFYYVLKVTQTFDENGELLGETEEIQNNL